MRFYLAPMEGITGYIYRNALYSCYNNIDKYFTPFIMPNRNRCFNSRELKDVLPENNRGMYTVPQILSNNAEDFVKTALELQSMGYDVQLRTSEHRSMYSYVRLSSIECTATYV